MRIILVIISLENLGLMRTQVLGGLGDDKYKLVEFALMLRVGPDTVATGVDAYHSIF